MKKVISIILSMIMVFTLTGCRKSSSNEKTFTYASELDIKNLDSSDADDGMSFMAMHACIDGLMSADKNGKAIYAIARKHTVSADGLTHTFKLRDAKWSNGDEVTANDFVYAWRRIFKNNGNYAYMFSSDAASITGADELVKKQEDKEKITDKDLKTLGVKAIDKKTLEVKTTRYISYFDELMAFPCYYPINEKFCKEQGSQYGKSPKNILSNGAFVMKTWNPGSKAVYEKNKDYWNAKNIKLDKLVFNLVVEPKVAATNYDSGKVDYATINSELVDKYKGKKDYRTFKEGYLFYLSINFKNQYLANSNIRKALSYAINREDFCDNVLKDGSFAAKGFIPSGLTTDDKGNDFRASSPTYTGYDMTKAQQYFDAGLKELGVNNITLSLTYGTDESPMDQMATYLQNAFTKLNGLKIDMVATTKQDRIYNKQKNGDYDIALTRWGPDYSDPTTYLNLLLENNSNNYGKYSSTEYNNKMDEVKTLTDNTQRWKAMQDAEKICMDDYAVIPVFEKGTATLLNPKKQGIIQRPVVVTTFNYIQVKK